MRLGGWILMAFSWGLIIGMATFCFVKIFKKGIGGDDSKILKRLKKGG